MAPPRIVLGITVRGDHVTAGALIGTVLVVAGAWLTAEARRPDAAEDRASEAATGPPTNSRD